MPDADIWTAKVQRLIDTNEFLRKKMPHCRTMLKVSNIGVQMVRQL